MTTITIKLQQKDGQNWNVKHGRRIVAKIECNKGENWKYCIFPSARGGLYYGASSSDEAIEKIKHGLTNYLESLGHKDFKIECAHKIVTVKPVWVAACGG